MLYIGLRGLSKLVTANYENLLENNMGNSTGGIIYKRTKGPE